MYHICQYIMSRMLTKEQCGESIRTCEKNIDVPDQDPKFLSQMITHDETYFLYDSQTKSQSVDEVKKITFDPYKREVMLQVFYLLEGHCASRIQIERGNSEQADVDPNFQEH